MKITAVDIQLAIYFKYYFERWRYFLPNVYFFNWESDFLAINDDGEVIEFEVKLSQDDFREDLKKRKHLTMACRNEANQRIPTRFYYVCPPGVIYPRQLPEHAGLLWLDVGKNIRASKYAIRQLVNAPKLSSEVMTNNEWLALIEKSNDKMIKLWQKQHGARSTVKEKRSEGVTTR